MCFVSKLKLNNISAKYFFCFGKPINKFRCSNGRLIFSILTADFACAAVLITFGAVLGRLSPLQMIIMALLEIAIFQGNEYLGLTVFKVRQSEQHNVNIIEAFCPKFKRVLLKGRLDWKKEWKTEQKIHYLNT